MNPIKSAIMERLGKIDGALTPLATACGRYLRCCSAVDPTDETIMIGHQPWKGPEAYAFRIYPAAKKNWFSKYSRIHGVQLPTHYRAVLGSVNGVEAFGLSLYGIPASMVKKPPHLDRSRAQCLDVASANIHWKRSFPGQEERFHFGGRNYSHTQNSGYFWDRRGDIVAVLKSGETVGRWSDFRSFLSDELQAAEMRELSESPEAWWQ